MDTNTYRKLVKKLTPKEDCLKNFTKAFLTGGFIGIYGILFTAIIEGIFALSHTTAITWMVISLIFWACLFTALGFFDNWVSSLKAGLIVPTTGFAHSIMSAALDYKKDGLITGLGSNFFKLAGSVLLFGIEASFILALGKGLIYG